jgi:2',3'-cyclic-nucleotide 2'-phosphodiesterase (5'-nucleotidase family)
MSEKAHLIIESFNLMGYHALGIGDDDLTLGKEFLSEISKKANFPFLSSNLLDEASGKTLFHSFLIKEIDGLRIGMFSLLSPDFFTGPTQPRKKGVIFRSPIETAQAMVRELKPKTDLIILLSHLGYGADMEMAQNVQGINIIVGSHNGINLIYPPIVKNTIILQNPSRGMYGARLDLLFYNNQPVFYNSATLISYEKNLNHITQRLSSPEIQEAEKTQMQKAKEEMERALSQLRGKNLITNSMIPLQLQMKEHPEIKKLVEAYKTQFSTVKPPPPTKQ